MPKQGKRTTQTLALQNDYDNLLSVESDGTIDLSVSVIWRQSTRHPKSKWDLR